MNFSSLTKYTIFSQISKKQLNRVKYTLLTVQLSK